MKEDRGLKEKEERRRGEETRHEERGKGGKRGEKRGEEDEAMTEEKKTDCRRGETVKSRGEEGCKIEMGGEERQKKRKRLERREGR